MSAGKLSANVILDKISGSSDMPDRFFTALETRHRVVEAHMMTAVPQLQAAIAAHKQMQFDVQTDVADAGTSLATALSKFFTSVGNMVRGHIAASVALLDVLNDVYWNHVDYLVTGFLSSLERVDSETAEAQIMINIALAWDSGTSNLVNRLELLKRRNDDARNMSHRSEDVLNAEALKSSRNWLYFPNLFRVSGCSTTFHALRDSLETQRQWLDMYTLKLVNGDTSVDDDLFRNMTQLRSDIVATTTCLLSYKELLTAFKSNLDSQLAALNEDEFSYDAPTSSILKFNMAGQWLQSVTRQYVAGSLSKRELAEALYRNGSEVVYAAERLYSDIELSLFTKITNEVNNQETEMVSFYGSVLRRVSELQRYMYEHDTSLEQFVRRFSIWRMPIVNYQKAQVLQLPFGVRHYRVAPKK